ncbi:MAG TPA: DUF559 domain-containing protein [Acidimicrobiales bacterium]|nr:DUF559 domain-containing protein [Acidimicrobiales bacterium]
MHSVEADVLRLAETQFALVTTAQARRRGMTRHQLHRRLATGVWMMPFPSVDAMSGVPWTFERVAMAALLAAGPLSALSHGSGARIWELRGATGDDVTITVPRGGIRRLPGIVVHGAVLWPEEVVTLPNGLRVTSPALTLLDYGSTVPKGELETATHDALFRGLLVVGDIERLLGRPLRGRAGAATLRAVLADVRQAGGPTESEAEVRFIRRVVRPFDLPVPAPQYPVTVGHRRFHVDFAYPDSMVAIEIDGGRWHGAPGDRLRDAERDLLLETDGWRVCRFGWTEINRRPALVANRIRLAIAGSRA